MAAVSASCDVLQREITGGILRHTVLRGPGAPLVFLWVLGLAIFTAVWPEPALAVTWSVLAASSGALTLRDQLRRPAAQRLALRSFAARRFPTEAIVDAATRGAVERGVALFVEIAAMALEMHRSRGADRDLDRAVADAEGLVALQLESARHAHEFERVLRVIDETATVQIAVAATPPVQANAGAHAGHDEYDTRGAVAREAKGARELVDQIDLQLRELLLQLAQLDRRAGDLVQTAHMTQRTGETLERLRLVVMTRRGASEEAIRAFSAHAVHPLVEPIVAH